MSSHFRPMLISLMRANNISKLCTFTFYRISRVRDKKTLAFLLLDFHMKRIIKAVSFYIVAAKMLHGEVSTTHSSFLDVYCMGTARRVFLRHARNRCELQIAILKEKREYHFFLVKLHSTWSLLTILHVHKFDFMEAIEYTFSHRDELIKLVT